VDLIHTLFTKNGGDKLKMKMRATSTAVLAMMLFGMMAVEAKAVPAPGDGSNDGTSVTTDTSAPQVTVTVSTTPPPELQEQVAPEIAKNDFGNAPVNSGGGGTQPKFKSSLLAVFKSYMAKRGVAGLSDVAVKQDASALAFVCPGIVLAPASVEAKGRVCLIEGLY
jgi:ABC-type phosphate transport system substrate-binding protein